MPPMASFNAPGGQPASRRAMGADFDLQPLKGTVFAL